MQNSQNTQLLIAHNNILDMDFHSILGLAIKINLIVIHFWS